MSKGTCSKGSKHREKKKKNNRRIIFLLNDKSWLLKFQNLMAPPFPHVTNCFLFCFVLIVTSSSIIGGHSIARIISLPDRCALINLHLCRIGRDTSPFADKEVSTPLLQSYLCGEMVVEEGGKDVVVNGENGGDTRRLKMGKRNE